MWIKKHWLATLEPQWTVLLPIFLTTPTVVLLQRNIIGSTTHRYNAEKKWSVKVTEELVKMTFLRDFLILMILLNLTAHGTNGGGLSLHQLVIILGY